MAKLGVTVQKAGSSFLEQTINVTSGKLENDILQAGRTWKNQRIPSSLVPKMGDVGVSRQPTYPYIQIHLMLDAD